VHHYANHVLVNDDGNQFTVKTYLNADGTMVQHASTGFIRKRAAPVPDGPEHKQFPQYGAWHDPTLEGKSK
jgi:hypothetical protein